MKSTETKIELRWHGKDDWESPEPHLLIEKDLYQSEKKGINDNFLIYGDNLIGLKALERDYTGKIKCIYIDPPYNTNSCFDHYNDNLEHSLWLNMMKERLVILHRLLRKDGTLWISIDDDECHYLKVLCDEVFERKNFVANVIWEKKYSPQNDAKWLSDSHDHILVYAKNSDLKHWDMDVKKGLNLLPRTQEMNDRYKNPDNDPRGIWQSDNLSVKTYSKSCDYPITTPSGRKIRPPEGRAWSVNEDSFQRLIKENRIWFGPKGDNVPRLKRFLSEVQDGTVSKTIWTRSEVGDKQEAKKGLNLLPRTQEMNARYKNFDKDPRGIWKSSDLSVKRVTAKDIYPIVTPSGREVWPPEGRSWSISKDSFQRLINDNRIWFGPNGNNVPSMKRFLSEVQEGSISKTIWGRLEVGDNQEAKKEVKKFNSESVFQTPKPERLLQRILTLATNPGDIVLDSFAGSGTTGAVAQKMDRRWIMIELGEHCHTHIIPRLRKVIDGTDPGGITEELGWAGGGGFHYCEMTPSLLEKRNLENEMD